MGSAPVRLAWALVFHLFSSTSPLAAAEWRYVTPPLGDPFAHPPLRALTLIHTAPADVRELVHYRGVRRRYAQIRYGSPGSVRMTVVVDELAGGETDLYVDADRNRRIEEKDRVMGEGRLWRIPISVAVVEGETTRLTQRSAVFRMGATGLTFSFAAAGYLEGTVNIAGRVHSARRTDGDGNGFLTDAQDRLWIDLDDDGRWDAIGEQFLYTSILSIGDARYAVRSDELGTRLALLTLEGTGTVSLVFHLPRAESRVAEVHATLIGRDGSAVGVGAAGDELTVPAGEYRLGTLTLAFEDPAGGPRWSFIFSDDDGKRDQKWYKVEKGTKLEIDPVGRLDLETGANDDAKNLRPGDEIALQPKLYTGDGLLINTCFRGTPTTPGGDEGAGAEIKLVGTADQSLAVANSGFA